MLELSSFQIDLTPGLKPMPAFSPTFARPSRPPRQLENYAAVKARILPAERRRYGDLCVDDRWCARLPTASIPAQRCGACRFYAIWQTAFPAHDGILRDTRNGKETARIDLMPMRP